MDNKTILYPCMCGGKAVVNKDNNGCHYVYCLECGIETLHRVSEQDVINSWNNRKLNIKDYNKGFSEGYKKAVDDFTEKLSNMCFERSTEVILNNAIKADILTLDSVSDIIWNIAEQLKREGVHNENS